MRRLAPIFALLVLTGCAFAQNSSGIQAGAAISAGGAIIPNGGCRFLNQSLQAGSNGTPYDVNLLTADCVAPTQFSLFTGSFPPWATLNPSTGEISGIAATGSNTFVLKVVDGEGVTSFSTQLVIAISGPAGSWPLPLDAFTSSACTSQACEPHGTNTLCVGTPVNPASLPGGGCASSFAANTSGLQAAINSLPGSPCGTVVNIQNIVGFTQFTIPSGIACGTPFSALWDWITGDLSDLTPPEGQRISPCWMGMPQSAMPYYLFPTGDALCSAPARHLPRIMANALNGAAPISMAIPANASVAATGLRLQLVETTRDSTYDFLANAGIDLSFQPGFQPQPGTAGLPCSLNPLTGGVNALPVNALACFNVQPSYITVSQVIIHGDAQRQTTRGFEFAGTRNTVFQDSFVYDINSTTAGGAGDAQAIHGGGGHGYSGQGDWIIKNDFLGSSTQGVGIFCGNYVEPITPTTLKDGVPKYVHWTQLMSQKNAFWNPERGLTLNDTENVEGLSVAPAPQDQELVVAAPAELQQGQTFQLNNLLLNDTGGGVNRFADGFGTLTVDGTVYTTQNSANGIITKNNEHIVGSAPYLSNNQVTYTYNVCSAAGVPIAACTGATTLGNHVIKFTYNAIDVRFGAGWGGTRQLIATATIFVTSGAPTHQIVLSPDTLHTPDIELQPSYSDAFGNSRTFSYIYQAQSNFANGALVWRVCDIGGTNCVVGGNSTIGTINSSLSGLPANAALYTSGSATGGHSISVTDGTATSNPSGIVISNQATILDYDFKPATSKNLFELKCINIGQVDNSLFEYSYGGQGNSGGQKGDPFLIQPANQGFPTAGQTQDGSGNNTNNVGPEHANDFNGFNIHFIHAGGGFIIDPLSTQSLGARSIALSNILVEDANPFKYTNGWLKNVFDVFAQITGATKSTVVPGTSATNPSLFNVSFNHVTYVGGTSTTGNGSLLSMANNTAQFPLTGFTLTNSIIMAPGSTTFSDANGETPSCNQASGTGANNTEARALAGSNSAQPCLAPGYVFNNDAFVDLSASPAIFTSAPIYQPLDSDTTLFPNYNGGVGGSYCPNAGSPYAAGGARQALDGLALGVNCSAISTSDAAARSGTRTP